jgi:hypothetical protein
MIARFNALVERMSADGERMLEAMRPAVERANEALTNVARALCDAFPLCIPHRTEGWVRWCGEIATARLCFRSYGHSGRARVVRSWARDAACIPSLQLSANAGEIARR